MSDKVAEVRAVFAQDQMSSFIHNLWNSYYDQCAGKRAEWLELQKYIFATDTTTTTNASLPWKNSTTLPKLTQIRDNLHSNYLSYLFPNDKWLSWEAYTKDAAAHDKAKNIEAYMENKTRESNYRTVVSRLLLDYIDYGNAFVSVAFEQRYNKQPAKIIPGYIGPVAIRIDPKDIVFNPLADKFENTYKIIRSVKTLGELMKLSNDQPEMAFWKKALDRRAEMVSRLGAISREDFEKAEMYSVDGFGNLYEYYQSEYVEILEFYGDYHNQVTGELSVNRQVTVIDRSYVVRDEPIATYSGRAPIRHVGWRLRPNNLWAMGPLDNLVGMQYRIDHLENLKADAMDLAVLPPLAIVGEVEEFDWKPGGEIHLDEGGSISEVAKNINAIITTDNQIDHIMDTMELMAGAPKEAMGVRTPGEKTAFEVQQLNSAAGRIFLEKVVNFEVNLVEPNLNDQLEISVRNQFELDTIRVIDDDLGVQQFKQITADDITAAGIIRPVGARHFAQQTQDLQNLVGVFNSPLGQLIRPHTSAIAVSQFVSDVIKLNGYEIFSPNVAVVEAQQTQALVQQAQEDQQVQNSVPSVAPNVSAPPPGATPQPNQFLQTTADSITRGSREEAQAAVGKP